MVAHHRTLRDAVLAMKRASKLWSQVIAFDNLHRAAFLVLRGKRGQVQAGHFFFDLEGEVLRLQRELASRTYEPGGYRSFWISDPKPRLISAASFRDRVVHHALISVIEPVFERRFAHHSYACRKGKGNHRALAQFTRWARASRYVLKLDVRKFFPSIDHDILKDTIRKTIKDREVLNLCNRIIDGSNKQEPVPIHFPGDDLLSPVRRRRGIPIGNLTSQFFANVYLDDLDHFIKERLRVRRYLRYVDDFACFSDDRAQLRRWRSDISEKLLDLRLRLNEGKSRIRQAKEGIEFLGFVVLPDRLRLNARNIRRMRHRGGLMREAYERGDIDWSSVNASLQAWNAHAAQGDTWMLRSDVFRNAVFIRSAMPFSLRQGLDRIR